MVELQEKHKWALERFIKKFKKNPNVVAILLVGNYRNLDKNSDLDVYIIIKNSKFRERGNTWVNGTEIEYFINPIKQVEKYFEEELEEGNRAAASMLANGKILYQKGNVVNRLVKMAKKFMNKPNNPANKVKKELTIYQIDDLKKDLEDVYLRRDIFAFNQISILLLEEILSAFFLIKRQPRDKPKRLFNSIRHIDVDFANLYSHALIETDINKKYEILNKIVNYIEGLIGKRPAEWKLRGKCTYIK